MDKTKIEWCDSTWNPLTGCLHDCEYCYARKIANRFGSLNKMIESAAAEGIALDDTYFRTPDYFSVLEAPINDENGKIEPYPTGFYPTFHKYRLDELQKKKPRTIFVCSMADLFGEWVPNEWIEAVFEACAKAPQHRYLFLTKNPARYATLFLNKKLPLSENMYYGVSVTNMENASKALNCLDELINQTNIFLSVEPLLEDVSQCNAWIDMIYKFYVEWVIIGLETGNRADKVVPQKEWIDNIVEDCNLNDIPVFMKDSLVPIVGEENVRREFPWETPEQRKEG